MVDLKEIEDLKNETWWTLMDKIGTNYAERVQKAQKEFMEET
jgi:hypothetical protein